MKRPLRYSDAATRVRLNHSQPRYSVYSAKQIWRPRPPRQSCTPLGDFQGCAGRSVPRAMPVFRAPLRQRMAASDQSPGRLACPAGSLGSADGAAAARVVHRPACQRRVGRPTEARPTVSRRVAPPASTGLNLPCWAAFARRGPGRPCSSPLHSAGPDPAPSGSDEATSETSMTTVRSSRPASIRVVARRPGRHGPRRRGALLVGCGEKRTSRPPRRRPR